MRSRCPATPSWRLPRLQSKPHFRQLQLNWPLQVANVGELALHDLGERQTRRTQQAVRAYELVVPSAAESA
jgi:hypothetical protein